MKKRYFTILAVLVLVLAILAGCGGDQPLTVLQQKYGKVSNATAITQKIEITSGNLLQYSSDKTFTATDGGYSVVATEKRLNEVTADAEQAYTTTTDSYTVAKADTFVTGLALNVKYFEKDYVASPTSLKANVANGHEKDVVKLDELDNVSNMTLELTADSNNLTSIVITYKTGSSNVKITLTFNY